MAKKRANGEGAIRKRSNGKWEARYSVNGKRHSIYGNSQTEVRKKLTEATSTVDHGDCLEDSNMTVGQWLPIWCRDFLGDVKSFTSANYEMIIRRHINPTLGNVKLSALKTIMIQRLYNAKRESRLNPKTIKNIHGLLAQGTRHRAAVRVHQQESVEQLHPALHRADGNPSAGYTRSVEAATGPESYEHEAFILTAIFTGLRSGELLGLTWDCVDFENGLIRVTK